MKTPTRISSRPYAAFGKQLDDALKRSGIERKRLAAHVEVNVTMISHYCRGQNLPTRKVLQGILHLVRRNLRQPLINSYLNFDLPEQGPVMFREPNAELLDQIEELIDSGFSYEALGAANLLRQETLDPQVQQRLEDILFELHMRFGEYGDAVLLADSVDARASGAPQPDVVRMRAAAMKSIASRALSRFHAAGHYLRLVNDLRSSNKGHFDKTLTSVGSYMDILRRESILVRLGTAPAKDRAPTAKDAIDKLSLWKERAATASGKWLLLEAIGQCHLALGDPGGAEDILEDLAPHAKSCRGLFERCQILQGRCFAQRGQMEEAVASLQQAYKHAREMENRHHAGSAQHWLLRIRIGNST